MRVMVQWCVALVRACVCASCVRACMHECVIACMRRTAQECIHNRHDSIHAASFVVDPPGFSGRMIAANNFAICCVHNCCVPDGIRELEALLQSDPMRFFRREILFNLCTLYEVALSKKMALMKKTALKMVGDKYYLSHLQRKHYLLQ